MAKDYKANSSHSSPSNVFGGFFSYVIVLVIGIVVGLLNPFQSHHKTKQEISETKVVGEEATEEIEVVEVVTPKFDFYELLPEMEVEVEKEPEPEPIQTVKQPSYRVQVGSFKTKEEAERVKVQLAFIGLQSNIEPFKQKEGSLIHRIRLGPYKSAEDMQKILAELKQQGFVAIPVVSPL